MKRKKEKKKLSYFFLYLIIFCFFFIVFILIKDFSRSLFLNNKERINIVFYGNQTYFYSLDKTGEINYYLYFPSDVKIVIPGGYGLYRLGGLGKLVFLEKKPDIFKKTFSLATSSFVDYYFYPKKINIYYGFDEKNDLFLPSLKKIFGDKSNANFFDRLYLSLFFLKTSKKNYLSLPLFYDKKKVFQEKQLFKKTQGYFYKKILRQEELNIQIIYHQSYQTGLALSSMIEGEGIKVNDLTSKNKTGKDCFILENKKEHSATAIALQNFFHCQIRKEETDLYDIILILNNEENKWLYSL